MCFIEKQIWVGSQIYQTGKGFMSVWKGGGKLPQPGILLPMICSMSKNGPINKETVTIFFK